ncbi:MAG TPA: UDP-3-O-(3-hydroxymyristoyl)glucosamine N-acyltransferase [Phycisphaerae bacterium]|nr:UDP-3-O-(3-hydroxymyristoyl)glucosamine N-acyltransferase [Phycisphaerae bacterium]
MSDKTFSLAEIAKWVNGAVRGDATVKIDSVCGIAEARPGQITWLAHEKYARDLARSQASAVLVPETYGPTPMPAVLVRNPEIAIIHVLERFAPPVPRPAPGVHPRAVVDDRAQLGANVAIGPGAVVSAGATIGDNTVLHGNVFIGEDTVIGSDCEIWPGVVIRERCIIGNRDIIHPNTTVGADGFGYQYTEGRHVKIPQIGTVTIEDDVEIGANCAIDRAKFGTTRVGRGTKIDNLVQVAHNVQIGPGCLLVAQCGIAGSARLGRGVVLGGKVGVRDHIVLNDGVQSAACACISKDVPAGTTVIGMPAVEQEQWLRERGNIRRLHSLYEQVKVLTKRVEQLEATADH